MTTKDETTEQPQGIGMAAVTYLTDPAGLVFATEIPDDRPGVAEFVAEQSRHANETTAQTRQRIEAIGFARYVLAELGAGHLTSTTTANLLGVHYHDFYRMAYSTGHLQLPPGLVDALHGKVDDGVTALRELPGLVVREVAYSASMEDLSPLYAEVAFDPQRLGAPVMIVQHGDYPGSRLPAVVGLVEWARAGFFAIAVSKRARDGSAGTGDVWCRETLDIHDALTHCLREFAEHCDPTNVSIIGQSGGGMDTIACAVRFPDTFRCAVDIAGTLDAAGLVRSVGTEERIENAGESAQVYVDANRAFHALMVRDMGGDCAAGSDAALARDLSRCGVNNPYTRTFFVWDEEDGGAALYEPGTRAYLADQERHGYTNSELILSRVGDPVRFFHWVHPDQSVLRHRFVPHLLSGTFPNPVLSPAGRMVVPGFVRTKRFTVWLGRGDDAVARLEYELSGDGGEFRFYRLSSDPSARGRLILHRRDGSDYEVEFGLDDIVRV